MKASKAKASPASRLPPPSSAPLAAAALSASAGASLGLPLSGERRDEKAELVALMEKLKGGADAGAHAERQVKVLDDLMTRLRTGRAAAVARIEEDAQSLAQLDAATAALQGKIDALAEQKTAREAEAAEIRNKLRVAESSVADVSVF